MHAETPRFASKTTIFSKHEVFEVVVMVTLFFIFLKLNLPPPKKKKVQDYQFPKYKIIK